MKLGFFVSLLLLLSSPTLLPAHPPVRQMENTFLTELPWATVHAVLKKVEALGHYTYAQLEYWYDAALLTVEQSATGYVVRIYDEDGLADIILIDSI